MYLDVEGRLKRKNQLLFSKDSMCLQPLIQKMKNQSHRALIMWALDCGARTAVDIEKMYPDEKRPRECLQFCEEWARGIIKMPAAKKAILAVHAAAREYNDTAVSYLFHAVGQAGSTVHARAHAVGLPIYELSFLVRIHGRADYPLIVSERIQEYMRKLLHWETHTDSLSVNWAAFLKDD